MNSVKIATVAAIIAASMSGAAFAAGANDAAARANTSDPNSALLARDVKPKGVANDAAARANTRDPNSTPTTGSR